MNLPTLLILLAIAALFGLALARTLRKKGGCDCGNSNACEGGCPGCAGHTHKAEGHKP